MIQPLNQIICVSAVKKRVCNVSGENDMKKVLCTVAAVMFCASPVWAGFNSTDAGVVQMMTVDMGAGKKPPFKRSFKTIQLTDVALAEPVAVDTVELNFVDVRANGKAPFKRSTVVVPVVDAAVMEPSEARVQFRGKPPFNRHPL